MENAFIKTEGLCFSYASEDGKNNEVLKDINIEIEKGDFVAVLGHNGSGKSTFAKLLNLILIPTSGKILIDGMDITNKNMTDDDIIRLRSKIGMVFQNPDNQLVATIVEEDVAFGPENLGVAPEEIRRRVDDALYTVGMTKYARHSPHQLSGGQKQRVAIAGAIAMLPECIVFDESTAMLDPTGRADVMKTIERLNREMGITVIHITHNMNEALLAKRVLVIEDGGFIFDGTPEEVFSHVDELKKTGLGVPQAASLMYSLKKSGVYDGKILSDEKKCAKELYQLVNGK